MSNDRVALQSRKDSVATWLVFLAAWAFFLFSFDPRCDATIAGNDAVPYAMALEDEDPARILDPHHPFFHVLAWGAIRVLNTVYPTLEYPGTWALKLVSSAGGALAICLLFSALSRFTRRSTALLFALCFASTAGIRLYASVGESYWPALAAQLGLLLHLWHSARTGEVPDLGTLIAWTVLALVLRQDGLLIVPCVAIALAMAEPSAAASSRWRRPAHYLVLSGVMTMLAYAAIYGIYALQAAAPVGPVPWLTKLAQSGQWGAWGGLDPFYSADPALPSALRLSLELTLASWDYSLLPWMRNQGHTATNWEVLEGIGIGVLLLFFLLPSCLSRHRIALSAVWLFLLTRIVFYAWWQPGNTEYHAGHWIPLLVLMVMGIEVLYRAAGRVGRYAVPCALIVLTTLSAIANERTLLGPLRERHLHRQALQVGLWFAEGRRIASLDPLMGYALDRFGPIPHIELSPPAVAPAGYEAWAAQRVKEIGPGLADGIVFVRDTSLPLAFGTPPWSIEHLIPLLEAVLASPHARALSNPIFTPEDGPREAAWALRLEPLR